MRAVLGLFGFFVQIAIFTLPVRAQTTATTIFSQPKLTASLSGKTYSYSLNNQNPQGNYRLTLLSGDGQAHALKTCSGSLLKRILCEAENLVQSVYIAAVRPSSVIFTVNGSVVTSLSNSSYSFQSAVALRANNQLQILVKGLPTAYVQVKIESLTVPSSPPVLSQLQVPEGTLYTNFLPKSVSFSFQADMALASAAVNGFPMTLSADKKSASTTLDINQAGSLSYTITATNLQNQSTTRNGQFIVIYDAAAPTITQPSGTLYSDQNIYVLTANVADENTVFTEVFLEGSKVFGTGAKDFTMNLSLSADGIYPVKIVSTDVAGNIAEKSLSLMKDTTPLTLAVLSPIANSLVDTGEIEVAFTASKKLSQATVNGVQAPLSPDGKSGLYKFQDLTEGPRSVNVTATDVYGKQQTQTVPFTLKIPDLLAWTYRECPVNE